MISVFQALSLLTPYDIDKPKIRLGPQSDGGYIFADDLSPSQAVISFGISTEYRFDAEMADMGHDVYMFDHTIDGISATSSRMHFFKEGVAGVSTPGERLYSIEDHLERHNIAGDRLILKIDVEGAEFDSISQTSDECLGRFEQIALEVHNLHLLEDGNFRSQFAKMFQKLNRQFTLFHVHANNYDGADGYKFVQGLPVSNLLELSYIRTRSVTRSPSKTVYPTTLDAPCIRGLDKLLWFYPFAPSSASAGEFAASYDRNMLMHERNALLFELNVLKASR